MSGRACTNCGNIMPDEAQFCGRCGMRPAPRAASAPPPAAPAPDLLKTQLGVPVFPTTPTTQSPAPATQAPPTMESATTQPMAATPAPPTFPQAPAFPPMQPFAPSPSPIAGPPLAHPPPAIQPHVVDPAPHPPRAPEPQRPASAPPPAAAVPIAARTMLGFSAPADLRNLAPPAPAPAPAPVAPQAPVAPHAVPPANAPAAGLGAKTMLGVPSPELMAQLQAAAPPPQAPAPQAPQAPQPVGQPAVHGEAPRGREPIAAKTMLGVAVPGIAPLTASAPAPHAPPQQPAPQAPPQGNVPMKTMLGVAVPGIAPTHSAPAAPPGGNLGMRTMLGVAAPGIAPINPGQASQPMQPMHAAPAAPLPAIVPAPQAPTFEEPVPSAPRPTAKRGVPIAAVAIGGLVLVVLIGGVIAFLMRGGAPIVATAQLGATGNEQLHLKCATCADGTTAAIGTAKATFAHNEADIDLAEPLKIGDNEFAIAIDRPAMGRDEVVKVKIPVSYRIRADLAKLDGASPSVGVLVEAVPGSTVSVDGKPVTLDGSGKASVSFDVTAETAGFADETKSIDRKWSYEVKPAKGDAAKGDVTVKVAIPVLHLDAPLARHVTTAKSVWVSGRTSKDAKLTLNGDAVDVKPDGTFEKEVQLPDGETKFTLVASSASPKSPMAPRTGTFVVRRVANVDAELTAAAKGTDVLGSYDSFGASVDANVGKMVFFEGTIVEGRTSQHQALMVVDDAKGCAKGPCLLRVVFGGDEGLEVKSGQAVRGYGRLARGFQTKSSTTVPEIEAEILKTGKK